MPSKDSTQVPLGTNGVISYLRLLLWPFVLIIALVMFHQPLSHLLERLSKAEVSGSSNGGFKIALEVAANLGAAEATHNKSSAGSRTSVDINDILRSTDQAINSLNLSNTKVLWVDDNPEGQVYERNALTAIGTSFVFVRNTEEAMAKLKGERFNLVISDFSRKDDPKAGYSLLEKVKNIPSPPPLIIYSSSASEIYEMEAKAKGAYGQTNSPQKLFNLVIKALLNK